ncbi:hypothetical protein MMC11_000018 [Xylographa trunciseda]|nr:hypothetical protein [Xylographa trunciseda]
MPSPFSPPRLLLAVLTLITILALWSTNRGASRAGGSDIVVILASNDGGSIGKLPDFKEKVFRNRASYAHRHGYDFLWANISAFPVPKAPTPHWSKIPILRAAFAAYPSATWLWWLDLDALIMTPSLPLHELLSPTTLPSVLLPAGTPIRGIVGPTKYNVSFPTRFVSGWESTRAPDADALQMLVTQDEMFGINTGSFALRRGAWADWVLEMWTDGRFVESDWVFKEQDALLHLMLQHEVVRDAVGVVRQRALNAYPTDRQERETGVEGGAWLQGKTEEEARGMMWRKGDLVVHLAGCGTIEGSCDELWLEKWEQREVEREEDVRGAEERRRRGDWGIEVGREGVGKGRTRWRGLG